MTTPTPAERITQWRAKRHASGLHKQFRLGLQSAADDLEASLAAAAPDDSATPALVERFRVACRALVRERVVYGEDVETLVDVIAVLERLALNPVRLLVPGNMGCARCKFRLVRTNVHTGDGTMTAGASRPEQCPNGCGPLWPVTWEQEARECRAALERVHIDKIPKESSP